MKKGILLSISLMLLVPVFSFASEADLVIPEGIKENVLLYWGFLITVFGFAFGLYQFVKVKKLGAHKSMLDVAQVIYETSKTYLLQQGKMLIILFLFIGAAVAFYFGYLSDINSITEKVTRGAVGIQAVMGGEPIYRYRSKSVVGDLLGPTAGKASDYATAIGTGTAALTGGEISESDVRAVRRLIPYQNLIYIRRILNQLEEAAATAAQ